VSFIWHWFENFYVSRTKLSAQAGKNTVFKPNKLILKYQGQGCDADGQLHTGAIARCALRQLSGWVRIQTDIKNHQMSDRAKVSRTHSCRPKNNSKKYCEFLFSDPKAILGVSYCRYTSHFPWVIDNILLQDEFRRYDASSGLAYRHHDKLQVHNFSILRPNSWK
jgi:hypothetical protein